jgi:hypothetical protein
VKLIVALDSPVEPYFNKLKRMISVMAQVKKQMRPTMSMVADIEAALLSEAFLRFVIMA